MNKGNNKNYLSQNIPNRKRMSKEEKENILQALKKVANLYNFVEEWNNPKTWNNLKTRMKTMTVAEQYYECQGLLNRIRTIKEGYKINGASRVDYIENEIKYVIQDLELKYPQLRQMKRL